MTGAVGVVATTIAVLALGGLTVLTLSIRRCRECGMRAGWHRSNCASWWR